MRSISRQLKEQRIRAGLSLARLAALTDTSPSALCRYENGWDRFEVHTLERLATALNCRLDIRLRPIRTPQTRPTKGSVKGQLQRLFWDQRLTDARLESHPIWVLERVLDSGRIEDVHVLRDFWGRDLFLDRVAQCRFFTARTRHFWMTMLQKEGRSCTRKFSRETAFNS